MSSNSREPSSNNNTAATVEVSPSDLVGQIRALRTQIAPEELTSRRALRRNFSKVDAQFVNAAVNAIGKTEAVQVALGRTDEDLRQEIADAASWSAVIAELRSLLREAIVAQAERRNRIGLVALQAYKICEQLARSESNVQLDSFVAEMKRLNRFGNPRRKAAQPEAEAVKPKAQ